MLDIYSRNDMITYQSTAQAELTRAMNKMTEKMKVLDEEPMNSFEDSAYMNMIAAHEKFRLISTLARIAEDSIVKNQDETHFWTRVEHAMTEALLQTGDDSWSGRSNDLRRVRFDVTRDLYRDLKFNFKRN